VRARCDELGWLRNIIMSPLLVQLLTHTHKYNPPTPTVNLTGKAGGGMAKHMNSFTSPAKKSFFSSRKSSSSAGGGSA
jgi:hypothetical protein